jgi:hypothetical protein
MVTFGRILEERIYRVRLRMHVLVLTVLLSLAGFHSSIAQTDDPIDVIIIKGQSNADGKALESELPEADKWILEKPENIQYFRWEEEKSTFTESIPPYGDAFGLEPSLAHALPMDRKYIIINCSEGATSILDWKPDWNEEEAKIAGRSYLGSLYTRAVDAIRKATDGKNVRFVASIWIQGEKDAKLAYSAERYGTYLASLILQERIDLNAPDMKMFVVVLDRPPTKDPMAGYQVISAQINSAQLPNTKAIPSYGLLKRGKIPLHYNAIGQKELGLRISKELSPGPVPPQD